MDCVRLTIDFVSVLELGRCVAIVDISFDIKSLYDDELHARLVVGFIKCVPHHYPPITLLGPQYYTF
jgi:hypothetical protein